MNTKNINMSFIPKAAITLLFAMFITNVWAHSKTTTYTAYFQLTGGITADEPDGKNSVKSFKLNFENDDPATEIIQETGGTSPAISTQDGWYDISGRHLNKTPNAPGIYINKGRKLLIK